MTPKQKASNLYDKMTVDFSIDKWQTKQCALIAVDELIYETQFEVPNIRQKYWQEVKKELEKI
jgi:crotonobetainyl-CoA:carnitine CoA-transferase CaiB-like acyl-CoA transferase